MSYYYFKEENKIKNLNKDLILVILLSPVANFRHQSLRRTFVIALELLWLLKSSRKQITGSLTQSCQLNSQDAGHRFISSTSM